MGWGKKYYCCANKPGGLNSWDQSRSGFRFFGTSIQGYESVETSFYTALVKIF